MPRMTGTDAITADTLNDVMEFDSVIRVNTDLTVTTEFLTVYAPDLYDYANDASVSDEDLDVSAKAQGWTLLRGFTGQYSYSGPLMHESEYIGGGLADHILSHPGFYVAVAVETLNADGELQDQPAGWAVAYRETI